ncbi:MAG: regulatory signaling modulator protein AmpE [Gammaproteobacteria bacterium]|nr:regulatory signaling modulator protein AmpE [Gammaproteobacteria bacterium]
MTFIIIALCLFAERLLLDQENYRQPDWFRRYITWSQQLPWGEWMSESVAGILAILAPLLLAVGLLQAMFDNIMGGIPELLFASAVLLFCLGPRDLHHQVHNFIDAWDEEDEEKARLAGSEFCNDSVAQSHSSYATAIANGILQQAYIRTFSVIFWFIILGPIGAVLYRSCHTLKQTLPGINDLGIEFKGGVNRLLEILDWLPARITAFTYALSGNFHDATHEWWNFHDSGDQAGSRTAAQILARAGSGALGIDDDHADEEDPLNPSIAGEMALAMVLRSITIWIGLLAVITITSWVS